MLVKEDKIMAKGQIKQAQIKIDKEMFELLCMCQATKEDIAAHFGVGKETVIRWCKNTYGTDFESVFKEKRQKGLNSLRAKQFKEAMNGNTTLLIFLGKNYLNQSDKVENYNEEKVVVVNDLPNDDEE